METTPKRWGLTQLNRALARLNLRLDTLTAIRQEELRRATIEERQGHVVYPIPDQFHTAAYESILGRLPEFTARFDSFNKSGENEVGYQFDNEYFRSPDAEVLYTLVRTTQPRRILEIGCGHSTKIIRQAINDDAFECRHTCIDPFPRQEVSGLADHVVRQPIETMDPAELAGTVNAGDVLFIDTSHEVKPGNDVAFIFGCLLPQIPPGVLVHVHDIFLPYEYPPEWIRDVRFNWGEQYLVQAMLASGDAWEVIWPGYYLQRSLPDFRRHFPHLKTNLAQSLWFRRKE